MSLHPKNWFLIAPLALVARVHAQGQTALVPPVATLSPAFAGEPEVALYDLIARALRSNPQLPIARENLEAARQRAGAARTLLNPTLQLVPRLTGNNSAADTEVIVSQPLDVFGRRRAQAASLLANRPAENPPRRHHSTHSDPADQSAFARFIHHRRAHWTRRYSQSHRATRPLIPEEIQCT